ncbi:ROK family protein [Enterococcus sp. N342-3-1-2]
MKYLVYDIGGSYIKYGLISGNRDILYKNKVKTPLKSKALFVEVMKEIFESFKDSVEGIAISMPGKIDVFDGYAHTAGFLTFLDDTNIVDLFHNFTQLPISVENDGKCAALAESWAGALSNVEHGIVLVFGTGVGGGAIVNGKLYRGFNSIAGEFSFVQEVGSQNLNSYLGASGSVVSLIRHAEKVKGLSEGSLTGEMFFEQVQNGDAEAKNVLINYCDTIARHIFNLQYIFDPEQFAIGGGISEQIMFIEEIKKSIDRLYESNEYHLVVPKIVQCKFRNDANLIGALMNHHLNKVKKVRQELT